MTLFKDLEEGAIFMWEDGAEDVGKPITWHEKINGSQATVLSDFFEQTVLRTIDVDPLAKCLESTEI